MCPLLLGPALQYEPVVTAGNEALVHHMEVFQCTAEFDSFPHYNGPCDSKMKPERLNYCRHVLAAWAMGAQVGVTRDTSPWVTAALLPPKPPRSHFRAAFTLFSAGIWLQPCLTFPAPPGCVGFSPSPQLSSFLVP